MNEERLEIPLNDIEIVSNTRTDFTDDDIDKLPKAVKNALKELAVSIRANGVIQRIIVKRLENGKYRLICGERRFRASQLAGLVTIPARVMDIPENKILQFQIVENLQRKNITPMDEIRAIVRLRNDEGMTDDEISKAIGKHKSHIAAQFRIAKAVQEVHDALEQNQITRAVALIIAGLDTSEKQLQAVAALKRERVAWLIKADQAEKWISQTFGVQKKRQAFGGHNQQNKPVAGRFASDWKYYLLRFSAEQFLEWQEIVGQRNDFESWATAVEEVMSKKSTHVKTNAG